MRTLCKATQPRLPVVQLLRLASAKLRKPLWQRVLRSAAAEAAAAEAAEVAAPQRQDRAHVDRRRQQSI